MPTHPMLVQLMAKHHAAGLTRRAAASHARPAAGARPDGMPGAARRRAGWLLVELGLRLMTPRGSLDRVRPLVHD